MSGDYLIAHEDDDVGVAISSITFGKVDAPHYPHPEKPRHVLHSLIAVFSLDLTRSQRKHDPKETN